MSYGLDPNPPSPPTPAAPTSSAPGATVLRDTACSGCSYNLVGLPVAANCPECAMPIEQTLRGRMLRFAKPEYRHEVQAGLGLVLNGILLMIVLMVGGIIVAFAVRDPAIATLLQFGQFAIALMIALGYWRYTSPDPGFALTEQSNSARQVARIAVGVGAACTLVTAVVGLTGRPDPAGIPVGGLLALVFMGAGLLAALAWLVQFFAIMTYTAWIAGRIPDDEIARKARRYRWLLPVVYVVGMIIIIGPLIALVMYWNLLSKLREQVRAMG